MSDIGLMYDEGFLKHIPYPGNPEVPERISLAYEHLVSCGILDGLCEFKARFVEDNILTSVHTQEHIEYLYSISQKGYDELTIPNTDVYVMKDTFDAARLSCGGIVEAAKRVVEGQIKRCFCLNRPPGHHAKANMPSGFCYFNNTAIAIKAVQKEFGIEKVAIFDWDAHCGNGTMEIFYEDPDVLTISLHQDPSMFFPGTGFEQQTGDGKGRGSCANFPLDPGAKDADYLHIIDCLAERLIIDFNPDLIFVAAGQDSSIHDPISGLEVTDWGYWKMTRMLADIADRVCDGRLVMTLEGGYNLKMMPHTIGGIINALLEEDGENGDIENRDSPLQSTIGLVNRLRDRLL